MPIRVKDWTKVDGTIPNVRLVEKIEYQSNRWRYGIYFAVGLAIGQLTHWIF
jgi:hypothetical protein